MPHAKKTIFITGANGFIGRQLIDVAISKGYFVYAMVRKSDLTLKPKEGELVYGDITHENDLLKIFTKLKEQNIKINYLIHAAALTKSISTEAIFRTNYQGTDNLINILEILNFIPEKFVFISSLAASGPTKLNQIIDLDHSKPITMYGHSKLKAEAVIKTSGLPYIIIRPTAVYGPGERDLFSVFKLINKNINPILGNHKQELTFIYVKDLVDLILTAAESEITNQTYFASDGKIYAKTALADAIALSLNKSPINIKLALPVVKMVALVSEYAGKMRGKVSAINLEKYNELIAESWNCETAKTIHHFQFVPKYDLKKGVLKTTQWYKENKWIK